jgi:hypothetical protein
LGGHTDKGNGEHAEWVGAIFPSPAGMSLTKLLLVGNDLIILQCREPEDGFVWDIQMRVIENRMGWELGGWTGRVLKDSMGWCLTVGLLEDVER